MRMVVGGPFSRYAGIWLFHLLLAIVTHGLDMSRQLTLSAGSLQHTNSSWTSYVQRRLLTDGLRLNQNETWWPYWHRRSK